MFANMCQHEVLRAAIVGRVWAECRLQVHLFDDWWGPPQWQKQNCAIATFVLAAVIGECKSAEGGQIDRRWGERHCVVCWDEGD